VNDIVSIDVSTEPTPTQVDVYPIVNMSVDIQTDDADPILVDVVMTPPVWSVDIDIFTPEPVQIDVSTGDMGPSGGTGPQGPVGPTGPTGPQGPASTVPGPAGPQGPQGVPGDDGADGATGSQGVQGPAGPAGAKGDTGNTGATGPQGIQGVPGTAGVDGATGPQGVPGTPGAEGPVGPQGPQGIQGETGAAGTGINVKGQVPDVGSLPPTGNSDGDAYIVQDTGDMWIWDTETGVWINAGPIQGPQGEQGIPGPTGPQGVKGDTGTQGPVGATGSTGATGPAGVDGATGAQGPQGVQGPIGATGATGADSTVPGPVGPTGATGAQGPVGATGAQGPQGIQGPQGVPGEDGTDGFIAEPVGAGTFGRLQTGVWQRSVATAGDQMTGGLSFGSRTVDGDTGINNPTDLTRHLSLFDGWGGFSITSGWLNLVSGGMKTMSFNGTGAVMGTGVDLWLDRDPTNGAHAVPLRYLQNNYSSNTQGDTRWVKKTGDTMTGALYISSATDATIRVIGTGGDWPAVKWNTTTATSAAGYFESQRYGLPRWAIEFGTGGGEPGGNVGTDYIMNRFDDNGNWLSPTPFVIRRGTGNIETYTPLYLMGDPTTGLQAVPLQYLTNNYSTNAQGDARWVNVTGDVMTGGLGLGASLAPSALSTTRHLTLYDGGANNTFGFNVWFDGVNALLSYVVTEATHSYHAFVVGTAIAASIGPPGLSMGTGKDIILARDPSQPMHAVNKQYLDNNYSTNTQGDARWVNITGDTITGSLGVNQGLTVGTGGSIIYLTINGLSGAGGAISFLSNSTNRWLFGMDGWPVAGAGTDAGGVGLALYSYNNDGSFRGTALTVARDTWHVSLGETMQVARDPQVALEVATKQYVDNNTISISGGDTRWVNVTGDNMTGQLNISMPDGVSQLMLRGSTKGVRMNSGPDYFMIEGVDNTGVTSYQPLWLGGSQIGLTAPVVVMNSQSVTLGRDPGAPMEAATKQYVDNRAPLGGPYLPLAGGSVTGTTYFTPMIWVNAGPTSLAIIPNQGQGAYNSLLQTGDVHFLAYQGVPDSGALTLAPWSNSTLGIRIDGAAHTVETYAVNGINFRNDVSLFARLNVNGATAVNRFSFHDNLSAVPPQISGGYLAWNVNQGQGEVAFINGYSGYGGFQWLQMTGAGTWKQVLYVAPWGDVGIAGVGIGYGVAGGGSKIGFSWASNTIHAFVDGSDQGALALASALPVVYPSPPPMDGAGSAGSNVWYYAQGDHVHPTQFQTALLDANTSRAVGVGEITAHGLYMYGSPTGPVTLTMPVATVPTKIWAAMNITNQPITLAGASGGTITIQAHGNQAVWTDGGGVYALNVTTPTAASDSNDDAVANTRWVNSNFVTATVGDTRWVNVGGDTMTGRLTINAYTNPWGAHNYGAQLVVTGPQNNSIGIFDSSNTNGIAITNSGGVLLFNGMPALTDSTTPPVERLRLAAALASFSTPVKINYNPTDTSAQLWLSPLGGGDLVKSIIRFNGTFAAAVGDGGPRYVASIRSGFASNAWGYEHVDIWLTNTGNDANLDSGQARAVRFQLGQTTFDTPVTSTGRVRGQSLSTDSQLIIAHNPAYYFERNGTTGVWRFVDNNTQIFGVDGGGNATILGTSTHGGRATFNGIYMNNHVQSSATDLSQGIDMYGGSYGFSITGGTLNVVSGGGTNFYPNGTLVASMNDNGLNFGGGKTAVLGRDPSAAMEATTKQYVDAKFVAITGGDYVKKTGDTMTGALQVGTGVGYSRLDLGSATNSGHLGFHTPDGTRHGYIGNATASTVEFAVDAGMTQLALVAPTVYMSGVASVTSGIIYRSLSANVIGFGWDGVNGALNYFIDSSFQGTIASRAWVQGNYYTAPAADGRYLYKAGDTCTGALTVNGYFTCADIMTISGRVYVANNPNYWMGRQSSDGVWMIIDNTVGILTLTPGGQLSIPGTASVATGGIYYKNLGGVNCFSFYHDGAVTVRGWVDGNYLTDYAVGSWSDRRLKQDIAPSTFDCLAAINAIPLKQYRLRVKPEPRDASDGTRQVDENAVIPVGLIAQEVGEAFSIGAYPGLNGPRGEGYWQLNDQALIAALIGSVRQLTARLETLEQRIH